MAGGLAKLFQFLFLLPASAGLGNHWPLDDVEARALGAAWDDAMKSLPSKQAKAISVALQRYIPLGYAAAITYQVVQPRVAETRKLAADAQRKAEEDASNPQ